MLKRKKKNWPLPEEDPDKNVPRVQDLFVPDGLGEYPDRLLTGPSSYSRSYVLSLWPREIYVGWLDEIFSVGDIDLSVFIEPASDRQVARKLTEKIVSAEAQLIVEVRRGASMRVSELEHVVRDLKAIREAIQVNTDRMFYVTCLITVHAKSEEELEERCDNIESVLARKSAVIRTLIFRQKEALKSNLPVGNLTIEGSARNMTTGGVAAMSPVTGNFLSHPSGIYLGMTVPGMNPVFYDPFIGPPYLPNQHLCIFGPPGTGKSQTIKVILGRLSLLGVKCLNLDYEGEYNKAVENLYGGEIVRIEAGRPAGLNPLDLEPEKKDDGTEVVNIYEKVGDVRALFAVCVQNFAGRSLNAYELAAIEEAVREEYAARGITSSPESLYESGGVRLPDGTFSISPVKKKMPTLSDICERLKGKYGTEDLHVIMKPFLRGASLGMFDCETAYNPEAPVISFDLSAIRDEFTKLYAMFVIMAWAWPNFALKKTGNKIVSVDEAWMFMKWPESANFLELLSRRGRKHHTGLIIGSQFVEEFVGKEEGRAVIGSCASSLLMGQSPAVVDKVIEEFKLPASIKEVLQSFQPGEGLLTLNGNRARIYVETLAHEWNYVTTSGRGIAQNVL